MKLMGPYRHPVMMKKTGRLKDIAIVVYGRAVAALSAKAKGIPEPVRNAIRDAPAAIWSPARKRTERSLEPSSLGILARPAFFRVIVRDSPMAPRCRGR
jgi:hypothetical protein